MNNKEIMQWKDLLSQHKDAKKHLLNNALQECGGSKSRAARKIGISRQQYHRLCITHQVKYDNKIH